MAIGKRKEDPFFTKFKDFAQKLCEMGESFGTFFEAFPEMEDAAGILKRFESECDTKKHAIMQELNNSFVTPFDREDIFSMAEQLDDIADWMEEIVSRFLIYDIRAMRPEAVALAKIIIEITNQVVVLFEALPESKKNGAAKEAVIRLNKLEDEGDIIYRKALAGLFREQADTLEILKWKDMYEILENAIDAGEHLADTVEGILTKNA